MSTPVCLYGPEFGASNATVDARTAEVSGTDRLLEAGAYHRYSVQLLNANLAFLVTGIVGS
jgi:hypothetical protein